MKEVCTRGSSRVDIPEGFEEVFGPEMRLRRKNTKGSEGLYVICINK